MYFVVPRRLITAFTSARHLSLSWARSIQSIPPHPTSWRSILILFSYLRMGLPRGLFPSGFPTKTLYTSHFSPIRATCPAHLIILDFISRTILGEEYGSLCFSFCSFLYSLVTSFLLGTNILLNINICLLRILIVMFMYSYWTVVRRCVWSRNLKNEEAISRVGSQRHKKKCIFIDMYALFCIIFANWHSPATLTEVFPCFFLSCKANARVYLAKTGHGPHSS
jgi:hypothetical protein